MKSFLAVGALTLICACTTCPPAETVELVGSEWVATEIAGAAPAATATVNFGAGDRMDGTTGCNRYFASYAVDGTNVTTTGAGATKMACMQAGVMEQEANFLAVISDLARYEKLPDGKVVLTANDKRTIVLAPAVK